MNRSCVRREPSIERPSVPPAVTRAAACVVQSFVAYFPSSLGRVLRTSVRRDVRTYVPAHRRTDGRTASTVRTTDRPTDSMVRRVRHPIRSRSSGWVGDKFALDSRRFNPTNGSVCRSRRSTDDRSMATDNHRYVPRYSHYDRFVPEPTQCVNQLTDGPRHRRAWRAGAPNERLNAHRVRCD